MTMIFVDNKNLNLLKAKSKVLKAPKGSKF